MFTKAKEITLTSRWSLRRSFSILQTTEGPWWVLASPFAWILQTDPLHAQYNPLSVTTQHHVSRFYRSRVFLTSWCGSDKRTNRQNGLWRQWWFFLYEDRERKFDEDHIYTSNTLKRLNNELYNDDLGKTRVIIRKNQLLLFYGNMKARAMHESIHIGLHIV